MTTLTLIGSIATALACGIIIGARAQHEHIIRHFHLNPRNYRW